MSLWSWATCDYQGPRYRLRFLSVPFWIARLSTKRCHGECGDTDFHTHHLTWLGERRFTRQ